MSPPAPAGARVVLGLSADQQDAAAVVVVDGVLVAAAAEERFTRVAHDESMPRHAAEWCLRHAGVDVGELDVVAFHGKPFTAFGRIVSTPERLGPRGVVRLTASNRSRLWTASRVRRLLRPLGHRGVPVRYAEHHDSLAAAAFHPSPFERAAVLVVDSGGEWTTTSIARGWGRRIEPLRHLEFPDALGLFLSALAAFCGLADEGPSALEDLAPLGEPRFVEALSGRVVHLAVDGSFRLDRRWTDRADGSVSTPLAELLEGPPRRPDEPLGQREADVAASAQAVVEAVVLGVGRHAHELTGERRACLAGRVALNAAANRRLLEEGPFEEVWVQPAAADDGGALGAALWAWHGLLGHERTVGDADAMGGAFLGPGYSQSEVQDWLSASGVAHTVTRSPEECHDLVAGELAGGALVGWFEGRMEFGPRALGHRSILADPRDPTVRRRLLGALGDRETCHPFAAAVLAEWATEWFDLPCDSPYGCFTAATRSVVPACTHVDGSARVLTVERDSNPGLWGLLTAFERRTGCPVLADASFSRAGEPIVRTPTDALACFRATGLDLLVVEGCVVRRDPVGRSA